MAVRVVFIVGSPIPFVTVFGSARERLTCEHNFPVTSWLKVKLCLRLSLSNGWTLASAFTVPSFQYLDALPKDASFLPGASHASIIDAFTEGSCLHRPILLFAMRRFRCFCLTLTDWIMTIRGFILLWLSLCPVCSKLCIEL